MDIQENFLTRIIKSLLEKGIIKVVRNSFQYAITAGMGNTVGVAINIFWDLLQTLGGQVYNRLRENRSNNSIFITIRDEILNFIRGLDYMTIIKSLIERAMQFLLSLSGNAIPLCKLGSKCIN